MAATASAADYLKLYRPVATLDVGEMFSDAAKGYGLAKDIDNRRTLADIGMAYRERGIDAARDEAFSRGNLEAGTTLGGEGRQRQQMGINLSREQREQVAATMKQLSELGTSAATQDDNQWGQTLAMYRQRGVNVPAEYAGPEGRQLAIAQSRMAIDQIRAEIAGKQATAASANATAAHTREQTRLLPETTASQNAQRGALTDLTRVQTQTAQRELDQPKPIITTVPKDSTVLRTDVAPNGTARETRTVLEPRPNAFEPYKDANQRANVEETLRKEVSNTTKDYRTVREASASLEALSKNPSAASDIAIIFSFMKILDPQSVVREGEFATAQNAAGVPDRVVNVYNRILSGQRLNDNQRNDFLTQARSLAQTQSQQYQRVIDQYRDTAQRLRVDPRNVILDQELLSPPGTVAPGNSNVGRPQQRAGQPSGQGQPQQAQGQRSAQPVPPGSYLFDPATGQLVPVGSATAAEVPQPPGMSAAEWAARGR